MYGTNVETALITTCVWFAFPTKGKCTRWTIFLIWIDQLLPQNIMLTPPTAASATGHIMFDIGEPKVHVTLSTSPSPTDPANPFGTTATITPFSKFIRHFEHDPNVWKIKSLGMKDSTIERIEDSSKRYCYTFVGCDDSKMNPTPSMILTSTHFDVFKEATRRYCSCHGQTYDCCTGYRELLVYPSLGHFVKHTDQQA